METCLVEEKLQVTLYSRKSDLTKIMQCVFHVQDNIAGNKSTKPALLKELISYFEMSDIAEHKLRAEHLTAIKKAVLDYFGNRKGYYFKVGNKEPVNSSKFKLPSASELAGKPQKIVKKPKESQQLVEVTYSLEGCINKIWSSLLYDSDYSKIIKDRASLMPYIYSGFKKYLNKLPKQPISTYSITVMAGFIADQFGLFTAKEKEDFKNGLTSVKRYRTFLFDKAKQHVKKSSHY